MKEGSAAELLCKPVQASVSSKEFLSPVPTYWSGTGTEEKQICVCCEFLPLRHCLPCQGMERVLENPSMSLCQIPAGNLCPAILAAPGF